jgi:hypothetical protein
MVSEIIWHDNDHFLSLLCENIVPDDTVQWDNHVILVVQPSM